MGLIGRVGKGIFLGIFLAATLLAQFDTQGAQVISYFPQLADGGPVGQQWVTALTLSNPHFVLSVEGTAFFNADDGTALSLDFGNGPVASFDFTIPPQGTVTFTSTGASPTTVTGWARVISSLPVQGVVQFRSLVNGVAQQGVSAESTVASVIFRSPATASTGIAVANPYETLTIRVYLAALDGDGNQVASTTLSLPGLGHKAFNLNQILPMIAPDFRGSVQISGDIDTSLIAWTLSTEGGVLSSYPPSALAWPPSPWELIWKVWSKLSSSSPALIAPGGVFQLGISPDLSVDFARNSVNVFADTTRNVVHIVQNMAELTSDSESELAFVLGHALGHIIQHQAGKGLFNSSNAERDADQISLELLMLSGYDPYGAGGALGKLFMASGNAKVTDANFDNLATHGLNPQTSFQDRLGAVFTEIQGICGLSKNLSDYCASLKVIEHPEFPPSAPLKVKPVVKAKW